MTEYFYVKVNEEVNKEYWYSDFIGEVFLVREDSLNPKAYYVADGIGTWILREHCHRVNIESWPIDE